MKLDYRNALAKYPQARGGWLLHGDETLLAQQLLDRFRQHWRTHGVERQRLDVSSPADWRDVLGELGSLSLFASTLAIEVHGSVKPDASTLAALDTWMQDSGDTFLLVVMPKQDSAAQKTKFFKLFEQHGTTVQLAIQSERERQAVLAEIAHGHGLTLQPPAWSTLMAHTQNNLLAAQQALLRLASLHDPLDREVDVAALQPALVEQSRFSTFDLGDALLQGQRERVVQILGFLQESDEPASLVLWTLNKEMKALMQLAANPQAAQQLGIWPSRLPMYQSALRRLPPTQMQDWPDLLRRCDEAIKGVSGEVAWDVLLQTALAGTGVRLFSDSSHN
jgi:DNA polymerase-3 subunit delta